MSCTNNKKAPVAYGLAERIKNELLFSGELEKNSRLPGEVALAARLGAARSSVREALKLLEASGFVSIIPNRGAFAIVTSRDELPELGVRELLESNRISVDEMLEVRGCIEPYAARLCAKNADSGLISRLGGLLDEWNTSLDAKRLSELDCEFHRLILEGSGNRLLGELCKSVLRYFMLYSQSSNESNDRSQTLLEHRAILSAIAAGAQSEAEAAMRWHIELAKRQFSGELGEK